MTVSGHQHLVSTRAKPSECGRCHRGIWVGLVNGFEFKVDPTPLEPRDEIMIRLQSPKTRIFQTFGGVGFELQHRTAWHITKGDPRVKVLAQHDCNRNDPGIIIDFFRPEQNEEKPF